MTGNSLIPSDNRRPGLICPECRFFIEISIPALLHCDIHRCPGCGLELVLDRGRSRESMEVLSQVQSAIENVEAAKRGRF